MVVIKEGVHIYVHFPFCTEAEVRNLIRTWKDTSIAQLPQCGIHFHTLSDSLNLHSLYPHRNSSVLGM